MIKITHHALIATATAAFFFFPAAASASDTLLFHIYSRALPPSVVSQSLAGAGTAMPLCGFQGLVNPALATVIGRSNGVLAAGYGRDPMFDKAMVPFGVVFRDKTGGAMGGYYRYHGGADVSVHDAVANFSGRISEQVDHQGAVEFGMNLRYEHATRRASLAYETAGVNENGDSVTILRHRNVNLHGRSLLLDIGFYQPHALWGADFSIVLPNLAGYRWTDISGSDEESGWSGSRWRTVIIGINYPVPIGGAVLLQIPLDVEIANLFVRSAPNRYILRAGVEARVLQNFNFRFGYAYAPEDPLDLITDFNYKNLFFGGIGIDIKPLRFDFFAGRDEFGGAVTYYY